MTGVIQMEVTNVAVRRQWAQIALSGKLQNASEHTMNRTKLEKEAAADDWRKRPGVCGYRKAEYPELHRGFNRYWLTPFKIVVPSTSKT